MQGVEVARRPCACLLPRRAACGDRPPPTVPPAQRMRVLSRPEAPCSFRVPLARPALVAGAGRSSYEHRKAQPPDPSPVPPSPSGDPARPPPLLRSVGQSPAAAGNSQPCSPNSAPSHWPFPAAHGLPPPPLRPSPSPVAALSAPPPAAWGYESLMPAGQAPAERPRSCPAAEVAGGTARRPAPSVQGHLRRLPRVTPGQAFCCSTP
jgi:hypothetical protein